MTVINSKPFEITRSLWDQTHPSNKFAKGKKKYLRVKEPPSKDKKVLEQRQKTPPQWMEVIWTR